jgi:hypothetical protein
MLSFWMTWNANTVPGAINLHEACLTDGFNNSHCSVSERRGCVDFEAPS